MMYLQCDLCGCISDDEIYYDKNGCICEYCYEKIEQAKKLLELEPLTAPEELPDLSSALH